MLQALGTQFCMQLLCGFRSPPKCALRTWFFKEVHTPAQLKMQNVHTQRKCKSIRMRTTCEQNANNSPHYAHITHTNYTHTQNARTQNACNMHNMCLECFQMRAGSIPRRLQDACKTHATSATSIQRETHTNCICNAYATHTTCVQHASKPEKYACNTHSSTYGTHAKRIQHGTCTTHVNPTDETHTALIQHASSMRTVCKSNAHSMRAQNACNMHTTHMQHAYRVHNMHTARNMRTGCRQHTCIQDARRMRATRIQDTYKVHTRHTRCVQHAYTARNAQVARYTRATCVQEAHTTHATCIQHAYHLHMNCMRAKTQNAKKRFQRLRNSNWTCQVSTHSTSRLCASNS